MRAELGGPGPGCSAMRVRRLLAGELAGAARDAEARHLAGCARCQRVEREIAEEQARLARDVPFEALAAGVAEKLARPERSRPARWAPSLAKWAQPGSKWAPLAAAAAVAVVAGAALVRGPAGERAAGSERAGSERGSGERGADSAGAATAAEGSTRSKGGASAEVFVRDSSGVHALAGAQVAASARLLISLHPAARRFAAAVLLEPGEASALYSGPARAGPLPDAFEWTGSGEATLVIVLADAPVDAGRIRTLADVAPGAALVRDADVVRVPLRR